MLVKGVQAIARINYKQTGTRIKHGIKTYIMLS